VVEHPLGKGEVVSSILTGSTNKLGTSQIAILQNRAEQNAKRRAETHQIRTRRSPSGLRKLFDELRESAWGNDVARQSEKPPSLADVKAEQMTVEQWRIPAHWQTDEPA
jgi:hypothetical protein